MSSVKLVNITKSFDEKIVLQDINIDIKDGELVSLLGVSGCGKSTTLQLIAGFINPDSGDIIFNDKSVINTPTGKRDAVIVKMDPIWWTREKACLSIWDLFLYNIN